MTNPTVPVLSIDGAHDKLLLHTDGDRGLLREHAREVSWQHAAYCAAEAAGALRILFGESAHRAVFESKRATDADGDAVDTHLLVVFDAADQVIWYNRQFLSGCELVKEIDARDTTMPDLDDDTLTYIQGLIEWTEEAHYDGYLLAETLVTEPSGGMYASHYDGYTVALLIDEELDAQVQAAGWPARDGATGPQRTVLSPAARDIAVAVLREVLDSQGHMKRIPIAPEYQALLGEVIAALDPH
jgi:hypothetical protein